MNWTGGSSVHAESDGQEPHPPDDIGRRTRYGKQTLVPSGTDTRHTLGTFAHGFQS